MSTELLRGMPELKGEILFLSSLAARARRQACITIPPQKANASRLTIFIYGTEYLF
jgi:hypothetical protein